MLEENLIKSYEQSFKANFSRKYVSNYGENVSYTYGEAAEQIAKLHLLFKESGIKKGDKIALIGKNSAQWCITFMSAITYGAVIVPILDEFNPKDMEQIVNHSESVLLLSSDKIWTSLDINSMPGIRAAFSLTDFSMTFSKEGDEIRNLYQGLQEKFSELHPDGFKEADVHFQEVSNQDLVLLNYTSGTTGSSKGVMLTANAIAGNVFFGRDEVLKKNSIRILSFLPLAHAYGCAFDFLAESSCGCHITLLGKTPSPKVLLGGFADVKPNFIFTVPLVIEKIYKSAILPTISKPSMKVLLNIPVINGIIYKKIKDKLLTAMGGEVSEVVIGGAALNPEVERFFKKIKFPFCVGYGMTECAPLISYSDWNVFEATSVGHVLKGYMEARISKENPESPTGEIQVRGENTTIGYYKNEEATKALFTEDGWLRTGDMGTMDKEGRIFIKGRCKTMILGPSGQNIYPEEIEAKLNNLPYVLESLIIEKDKKLVALVVPDTAALERDGLNNPESIKNAMDQNLKDLNASVAGYERVQRIKIHEEEFKKTPKKSIKRYLYKDA